MKFIILLQFYIFCLVAIASITPSQGFFLGDGSFSLDTSLGLNHEWKCPKIFSLIGLCSTKSEEKPVDDKVEDEAHRTKFISHVDALRKEFEDAMKIYGEKMIMETDMREKNQMETQMECSEIFRISQILQSAINKLSCKKSLYCVEKYCE